MGDDGGGMDPCECVWGHELAMRRLLNVLRNSQADCTDSECYVDDVGSRPANPDNMLLMTIFVVTALFLYYFRPRRQAVEGPSKSSSNDNNPDGAPPNPPPAIN